MNRPSFPYQTSFKQRLGLETIPRAAILLSMAALAGCDTMGYVATPVAQTHVENDFDKLPDTNVGAKSILPSAVGPSGNLFGVLFTDNTQAWVFGNIDSAGDVTIGAVGLYDDQGKLIIGNTFSSTGALLTFSTSDLADIDIATGNTRITLTLNATTPPSVIVMDVDDNGDVTVDESASTIESQENASYTGNSRVKWSDQYERFKPSQVSASTTCAKIGNGIVAAVSLACDIKGFITKNAPNFVIQKMCVAANRVLDLGISGQPNSISDRVLSGLKASLTVCCEGLKAAVVVGNVVTKVNPLDAACLALSLANDGSSALTGESLAQQICKIFTSDQQLGGLITTATSVQVNVVDTGSEDGDQVELSVNGNIIFSGTITNAGSTYNVNLAPGLNHFQFRALNEGSIPPNTAQVTVLGAAGSNLGDHSYDLSTGQVETLDIVRN